MVIGLLPAATAACAVLRAGERPRPLFWAACTAGAVAITAFTLASGETAATWPDLLLVGALLSAAVGYTEGGTPVQDDARLAGHLPYTSSCRLPAHGADHGGAGPHHPHDPHARPRSPASRTRGLISMFLGFFPWYAGLARGGIARAGQTQLVQPLLTLVWAWFLMGERFGVATVVAALAVLACVAITQRART